jgi:hypothetical protein
MNENKRAGKTATEALAILWQDGFFVSWQRKAAVDGELHHRGNHFADAELGMALMRAKHLTRRGARGTYEYIQKYPFDPSESEKIEPKRKKTRGRKISRSKAGAGAAASQTMS